MDNISLKEIQSIYPNILAQISPKSLDDFLNVLYDELKSILILLEENPQLRCDDSEDRITDEIKVILRRNGYDATHDSSHGGHADLMVRSNGYVWLAEAKWERGNAYLWEGFLQLSTRYSSGSSHEAGAVLIYIKKENTSNVMTSWKEHIESNKEYDFECSQPEIKNKDHEFISTHTHKRSGSPYTIRHIPLSLYFDPQDRSGRNKKSKD